MNNLLIQVCLFKDENENETKTRSCMFVIFRIVAS